MSASEAAPNAVSASRFAGLFLFPLSAVIVGALLFALYAGVQVRDPLVACINWGVGLVLITGALAGATSRPLRERIPAAALRPTLALCAISLVPGGYLPLAIAASVFCIYAPLLAVAIACAARERSLLLPRTAEEFNAPIVWLWLAPAAAMTVRALYSSRAMSWAGIAVAALVTGALLLLVLRAAAGRRLLRPKSGYLFVALSFFWAFGSLDYLNVLLDPRPLQIVRGEVTSAAPRRQYRHAASLRTFEPAPRTARLKLASCTDENYRVGDQFDLLVGQGRFGWAYVYQADCPGPRRDDDAPPRRDFTLEPSPAPASRSPAQS